VISERRLESLRQLALALAGAQGHEAVLDAVEAELARNDRDMPFALVYLFDEAGAPVLARNCAGMDPDHPCAHAAGSAQDPWGVKRVQLDWTAPRIDECMHADLPTGSWDRPPTKIAVVPLVDRGNDRPLGALVVGLNPYRPAGEQYLSFLELLAGQITAGLTSSYAFEAERERAAALAEVATMREEASRVLEQANR
ncbi:GAF domain-containing protein, partial [Novosphingobium sp.]|uniref:GAF domain-containing protein n=1 Tax=Novosphingobium sp. TaxID=1874826 RepID=UPI0028AA1818